MADALPFLLPGLAVYGLFVVGPIFYSAIISLFEWNFVNPADSPWVGLRNYIEALGNPIFQRSVANTVAYSAVTVPAQIALGIVAALLLKQNIRARGFFRVTFYLPVITNWVIVGVLFKYAFNGQAGLVNWLLRDVLGVTSENVLWLADPVLALVPVFLVEIWKGVGWCAIIALAALQGIPNNLLEAGEVDGAGSFRRFMSITLPLLRPTITFLVVVRTIGTLNGYVSNLVITDGGQPMDQTHFVLTLMYEKAFGQLDFSEGAAISYFLTLFIFVISLLQLHLLRRPRYF